jgi:hypothetical protein
MIFQTDIHTFSEYFMLLWLLDLVNVLIRIIFQTDIHALFGVFHAIVVIGFGERVGKNTGK